MLFALPDSHLWSLGGGRVFALPLLLDPRPVTALFAIHQSLFTNHQTRFFPLSRAHAPPLKRGFRSKTSGAVLRSYQQPTTHNLPRFLKPAKRYWPPKATGIAKRYRPAQADWRRQSLYWRRDVLPAKNGVCPYFHENPLPSSYLPAFSRFE